MRVLLCFALLSIFHCISSEIGNVRLERRWQAFVRQHKKWQRGFLFLLCFLLLLIFCCFPFSPSLLLLCLSRTLQALQELRPQKSGAQPAGFFFVNRVFISLLFRVAYSCTIYILQWPFFFQSSLLYRLQSMRLWFPIPFRLGFEWQMMSAPSTLATSSLILSPLTFAENVSHADAARSLILLANICCFYLNQCLTILFLNLWENRIKRRLDSICRKSSEPREEYVDWDQFWKIHRFKVKY